MKIIAYIAVLVLPITGLRATAATSGEAPATPAQIAQVAALAADIATKASEMQGDAKIAVDQATAAVDEASRIVEELRAENAGLREALEKKVGKEKAELIEDANRANIRAAKAEGEVVKLQKQISEDPFAPAPSLNQQALDPFAPAPVPAPRPRTWTEVRRFTGKGNMRTPDFSVSSGEWRIRYVSTKTEQLAEAIHFAVSVEGPDAFLAFNESKPGSGVTMGKQPGRYWLDVSALFCDWQVLIEERR
jgi:hypothetical protein